MASIFRRSRKKGEPYWIQYTNHEGERKTVKGYTDRSLSEQLARRLEDEARLRRTGMIDPEQEKFAKNRQTPMIDALNAFERSLGDNTSKHVNLTMRRVRAVVDGCGFERLGDIDLEPVQEFLREFRVSEDIGYRTHNHYVQAIDSFCNWCVQTKRLLSNPLRGLERLNAGVDVRHKRRALTPEQFGMLVQSARDSNEEIQCFDGETRARIYILSYMTGLRRKEIASLTPRSFLLDGSPPTVTVEAACSKHRRKDVLPLHPELVDLLREWLAGLDPGTVLFPKLAKRRTWLMVKKDLKRVGIPYETPEGIADFHAAGRHTHVTELLRNGATVPQAMELARHTDVRMTMRYTHIGIEDQAKALSALQMRCIPGVVERRSVSPDGGVQNEKNDATPEESRSCVVSCHPVSQGDKVEAAGIEPASRDISMPASTCVAVFLISSASRQSAGCSTD
jgi:integrase